MSFTRRDFAKGGIASVLSLLAPASLISCAGYTSRKLIAPEIFENKLKGMILLGAYGDALGAYHEPRGLQGFVGNPENLRRLPEATAYQPPGSQATPWWVWVRGDELPEGLIGLPTDDSAFRLLILHPWLLSLTHEQPSEASFAEWMQARLRTERLFEESQWQSRRQSQTRDWLIMLGDAERWNASPESTLASFQPTIGNPFFRPEIPIVFGLFMYMELAALYAGYDNWTVLHHFSSFSQLDQGYARSVTGLFAGLVAAAIPASGSDQSFSGWYATTIRSLLKESAADMELLEEAFEMSWATGIQHQDKLEKEFLEIVKQDIYEAPLPSNRDQIGFRVFDPLLFFKQITAAVAYAGADIPKALILLANNPGDADTLPSMLGTLAGAWAGYSELSNWNTELGEDLAHVEKTLRALFGYDVHETSKQLALLARDVRYA